MPGYKIDEEINIKVQWRRQFVRWIPVGAELGMDQKRKISQSGEYHNSKRKLRFGFIVRFLWLFMALMSFMFCGQKWLQINTFYSKEFIFIETH